MAIAEDVEDGGQEAVRQPLVQEETKSIHSSRERGSWMVYFSTFVAVCGSYEFGTCVSLLTSQLTVSPSQLLCGVRIFVMWFWLQAGYSSPTQSAIIEDLHLSLPEV